MAYEHDTREDRTASVVASVEHALRMHRKARILDAQVVETLKAAAVRAGDVGADMDHLTFLGLCAGLRAEKVTGRGVLTSGLSAQQLAKRHFPPGSVSSRPRGAPESPWPGPGLHVVYVLRDQDDQTIYIGVTSRTASRMKAHSSKPWKSVTLIVCESRRAAMELEGDLIFQHQPPLNVIARDRRRWSA